MVSTVQTALSPSLLYFETVSLCGQARIKLLIPHLWLSSTRIIGISHQIWLKIFFENIIKSYLKEFLIIGPKAQMQVKIPIKRVTTLLNTKGNSQCKGLRNIPAALRQQPGSHSHFNSPSLGTGRKKKIPHHHQRPSFHLAPSILLPYPCWKNQGMQYRKDSTSPSATVSGIQSAQYMAVGFQVFL